MHAIIASSCGDCTACHGNVGCVYAVICGINRNRTASNRNIALNGIIIVIGAACLQALCTDVCLIGVSISTTAWESAPTASIAVRSRTSGLNIDVPTIDSQRLCRMECICISSCLNRTAVNGQVTLSAGGIGVFCLKGIASGRSCSYVQILVIRCRGVADGNAVIATDCIVLCSNGNRSVIQFQVILADQTIFCIAVDGQTTRAFQLHIIPREHCTVDGVGNAIAVYIRIGMACSV